MGSEWEINQKNGGYFDLRMNLQMLQWLQNQQIFDAESLRHAFKKTLQPTCWVSAYQQLTGENPPEEMKLRADKTRGELLDLNNLVTPFVSCMVAVGGEQSNKGPAGGLDRRTVKEWGVWWQARLQKQQQENPEAAAPLDTTASFTPDALQNMLRVGDIFLSFGELVMARNEFWTYLDVVCDYTCEARDNAPLRLHAAWGFLVASLALLPDLLRQPSTTQDWETAQQWSRVAQTIVLIDTLLEQQLKLPPQQNLLQQVWLLHWTCWALCLYYLPRQATATREAHGRSAGLLDWLKVLDYLVCERSVTVIRACCPHLLRYVAAMATVNRRKESIFQAALDAVRMASPAEGEGDCFAALLESLFINFDFQEAQRRLAHCQTAAKQDFLLIALAGSLEESCQLMLFETHCRTQRSICIATMAKQLHMTTETTERWIVDLIRHSSLAAKIDSERGSVEISTPPPNPYQQLSEGIRFQWITTGAHRNE